MALPQNDPSQQDFLSHKTTSSSGGESFSNSKYLEHNVSPTDAASGRQNRTATGSSSGRSAPGSLGQTYIPNWSDIFPPPPDQPPPPSGDSPPNSPRSVVRSRQQQQVITGTPFTLIQCFSTFLSRGTFATLLSIWRNLDTLKYSANLRLLTEPGK